MKLYRIGELAKLSNVSQRTIDYYTRIGLIRPYKRSASNYRYYSDETLQRLQRIQLLKQEKLTLEEIKQSLDELDKIGQDDELNDKLSQLRLHLRQLEKEAIELRPIIERMKPRQARHAYKLLTAQTAACIEALLLLLGKGPLM